MTSTVPTGVAEVLVAGGAPASLAGTVSETLGPDAPGLLTTDPWRLLDVRAVRPEQADAFARRVLRGAVPDDPRRGAALVAWHLRRAAADGHTAVPELLTQAALAGQGVADPWAAVEAACDDGRVLLVPPDGSDEKGGEVPAGGLLASTDLAYAEDALAEGLLRLQATAGPLQEPPGHDGDALLRAVAAHGVVLAESPGGSGVGPGHSALADLPGVHVTDQADLLDVHAAAALVESLADGERLVLVGDPALLPPAGPGRVLGDAVASGRFPVVSVEPARSPVVDLVSELRAGRLPEVDVADRAVVVLPTTDPEVADVVVRVVAESVPRVHGLSADDVVVVTPRRAGVAGVDALDAALSARLGPRAEPRARCVHEARGRRWPAVVVVLPAEAAGVLDRALVATACSLASRHVCVVAAAGAALREAVQRVPARHRTTRLAGLLRSG
ncbi:MAG TPA: helix-hairpin-helix domain-containing protein [Jiangellales bacterium]|nr:helix-hairpin-helix domain-containing protein [Jiangellales bacterium]